MLLVVGQSIETRNIIVVMLVVRELALLIRVLINHMYGLHRGAFGVAKQTTICL
ncbi:hypothetical protein HanIR_Chr03g0142761 [Helianthus annuus]|nr:hypothetical protein HanIR_Chr03g0142761 [Helianthus annuus]